MAFKILVSYLIFINIIGFIFMYYDKRMAIKGKWRIKEKTLLLLGLLGAAPLMILAMKTFKHKVNKIKFLLSFIFSIIMWTWITTIVI